jgi:hypothetical protein
MRVRFTHAQFTALSEVGYMEMGLFPRIPSIENRILESAKLLFGIIGSVGLSMLSLEPREKIEQDLSEHESLSNFMQETILKPNRFDHLLASIAEDRHWVEVGKNRKAIAYWFSSTELRRQLELFHRQSQPKRLGKQYRRSTASS